MDRYWILAFVYCLAGLSLSGCTWGTDVDPAQMAKDMTKVAPLQIHLETDKEKVALEEIITFTTTVYNPNTARVNLFVGPSYLGHKFQNGLVLQARKPEAVWKWENLYFPQYFWEPCGTGAYSLFAILQPKSHVQFRAKGILKGDEKGLALIFGHKEVELRLPKDGKYIVRTSHTVNFNHDFHLPPKKTIRENQALPPDMKAPFFEGTLISNDVVIEVQSQKK